MTHASSTRIAQVLATIIDRPLPNSDIAEIVGTSIKYATACVRELKRHGYAEVHHIESGLVIRRGQRMGHREWISATPEGHAALKADPDLTEIAPRAAGDTRRICWPRPVDPSQIGEIYGSQSYEDDPRANADQRPRRHRRPLTVEALA